MTMKSYGVKYKTLSILVWYVLLRNFYITTVASLDTKLSPKKNDHIIHTTSKVEFYNKKNDANKYSNIYSYTLSTLIHHRVLNANFEELNTLFQGTKFKVLETTTFEEDLPWPMKTVTITVSNIICSNIQIGDINVGYDKPNQKKLILNALLKGINIDCDLEYKFQHNGGFSLIKGEGTAQVYTSNNNLNTSIAFLSQNFNIHPPHEATSTNCNLDLNVDNIDIQGGGLMAQIANLFEQRIKDTMKSQINGMACTQLGTIGSDKLTELLGNVSSRMEPYLISKKIDPLSAQKSLKEEEPLLNFSDVNRTIGNWFSNLINSTFDMLGTPIEDSTTKKATLRINKLLQQSNFFTNNSLNIDFTNTSSLSFLNTIVNGGFASDGKGIQIFNNTDMLTSTTMHITNINITGLDTISMFEPLDVVSPQTLQNKLGMDGIDVKTDFRIVMKPSEKEGSVVVASQNPEVVENISIQGGIKNIQMSISFLLGILQLLLGDVQIGSLFYSNHILPCFTSTLSEFIFTEFNVDMQDILPLTLSNFISIGIDKIISTVTAALMEMYEDVVILAMPNFFQDWVRGKVNEGIGNYTGNSDNTICPKPLENENLYQEFVDFRILLSRINNTTSSLSVSPTSSVARQSFLPNYYGNLPQVALNAIDTYLVQPSEEEYPKINDLIIRPFTISNSNISGTYNLLPDNNPLHLLQKEKQVNKIGFHNFSLQIYDTKLQNLDTISYPFSILQPHTTSLNRISNTITIGSTKPLSLSSGIKLHLNNTILQIYDNFILNMNVSSLQVNGDVVANMKEEKFMSFPLRNVIYLDCWLSTILPPSLYSPTNPIVMEKTLGFENVGINIDDISFDVNCLECSSTGILEIPTIIQALERNSVMGSLYTKLFTFIKETSEGNYLQSIINDKLYYAEKSCKNKVASNKVDVTKDSIIEFTKEPQQRVSMMTQNGIEFFILSGVIALQTAGVVITKSLLDNPPIIDDSPDVKSIDLSKNLKLLDFQQLGDNIGPWFPTLLKEASTMLNVPTYDDKLQREDLAINVFLRNSLLKNNSTFTLSNLGIILYETYGFNLLLNEIAIDGLDTFTNAHVLNITDSYSISNSISMQNLKARLTFLVDILYGNNEMKREDLILEIELKDLQVIFDVIIAMDLDKLGSVQIGSLLDIKSILPCVISAAHSLQIVNFLVSVEDGSGRLSGSIIENIRGDLDKVTNIILGGKEYKENLLESLPFIFHSIIRPILNSLFESYQQSNSGACKNLGDYDTSTSSTHQKFIDFRDLFLSEQEAKESNASGTSPYGNLFRFMKKLLNDQVLSPDESNQPKLNKYIQSITKAQSNTSGTILFPDYVYKQSSKFSIPSLSGSADIGISNIRINNLDTLGYPLYILDPNRTHPYILENALTMGTENPLQFMVHILVALQTDEINMKNEFDLSIDMNTITLLLDLLAKIDVNALFRIPLRHMLNYNCWIAAIPPPTLNEQGVRIEKEPDITASLQTLEVFVQKAVFGINCTDCSGPALAEILALSSTENGIEDSTAAINNLLNYAATIIKGEYAQVNIDRLLNHARNQCPIYTEQYEENYIPKSYKSFNTANYEDENIKAVLGIAVSILVIILFISLLFYVRSWFVQKRHEEWLQTLSPSQALYHYENQLHEEQESKALNRVTKSMFQSDESIPMLVRIIMPIVIVLNIGLFLSGHLDLGATITIRMQIAGQDMPIDKFFEFSMGKSVVDMWKAGAKFLAALICLFSGVWPYSKQLISLYLWFVPPTWVSVHRRGSIFHKLDALAKWSIVDIFVLIMSMIGFWVSIQSPQKSFLPKNLYSINLMVIPVWGLYANLIAQLISQISSHFIVHYHHKVKREGLALWKREKGQRGDSFGEDGKLIRPQSFDGDASSEEEESLKNIQNHTFSLEKQKEGENVQIRKYVSPGFVVLSCIIFSLFIVGFILPSFQVEYLGIVGILVEMGQQFQQAVYQHSILSITQSLMNQARFLDTAKHYVGLGLLAIVFVVTSFIVPLIQLVIICMLYFKPMTRKRRKHVLLALDTIQSWQYAEVYVISVFIGTWQFGGVSSFMINDFCGSLSSVFSSLAYYGIVSEDDAQCFYVESIITSATYFLVVACILLYVTTRFVKKASLQQLVEYRPSFVNATNMTEEELRVYLADRDMDSFAEGEDLTKNIAKKIRPIQVQFTDEYSCLLKTMNTMGDKGIISPSENLNTHFISDDVSVSLSISDVEMNPSTPHSWDKPSILDKDEKDRNDENDDVVYDKNHRSIMTTLSNSIRSFKLINTSASHISSKRTNKDISEYDANSADADIVRSTMPFFGNDLDEDVTSILSADVPSALRRPLDEDGNSLAPSHICYDISPLSSPTIQKPMFSTMEDSV